VTEVAATETQELSLGEAQLTAWQRCVRTSVFGYNIQLCLSASVSSGAAVMLTISLTLGGKTYTWNRTLSGDISYTIAIFGGLSLQIDVRNWNIRPGAISFTLTVKILVFGFSTTVYSGAVTIPLTSLAEEAALRAIPVSSPRELADLLTLLSGLSQTPDQDQNHFENTAQAS
jgi:hypothetical protein